MEILIDSQKVVEVDRVALDNEYGETEHVIPFSSAHELFTAWMMLDEKRRNFRYTGNESDSEPCTVILMWVQVSGVLEVIDVDPFWDGGDSYNGWTWSDIDNAIGWALEATT